MILVENLCLLSRRKLIKLEPSTFRQHTLGRSLFKIRLLSTVPMNKTGRWQRALHSHEAEIQQLNDAWLERGMAESLASMNVPKEPVKETQQLIPVTTTSASATLTLANPTVKEVRKVPSPCTTSSPSPMAPNPFWPSFDGKIEHQSAKGNFSSLETRQRRLVSFGNKDVSIIKRSCSSPTDWANEQMKTTVFQLSDQCT